MSSTRSLPPEFTIYSLANLHKNWLASLPKGSRGRRSTAKSVTPWQIEGSAVTEVDAAAVQLLVSLSHALTARHRALALTNPSRPLVAACEALGVAFLVDGRDQMAVAT